MLPTPEALDTSSLCRRHLSFSQVLASSLGIMGISGSVVIMLPLIFANAGNGTYLAVAVAMFAYVLVAFQINVFARRFATSGSLYVFTQQGLGTWAGVVVGWALFVGYWGFTLVNIVAVSYYLLLFIRDLMRIMPIVPPQFDVVAMSCGVTALALGLAYRGIKLSARVILFIECVTISFLALIVGKYFYSNGFVVDVAQFTLSGVTFSSFSLGLVLAMACFTGFEGCSVLGFEAKLPLKMIPRANLLTIFIAGFALVLSAYALVQFFHDVSPSFDKDEAPLSTLSASLGLGALAPFIIGGVAFSWFGCLLGCFNTGARLLYSLSQQGMFHSAGMRTHARHRTPHIAIALMAATGLGIVLILLCSGMGAMDIINYGASFATLGFLIPYIFVSIAAVAFLVKHKQEPVKALRVISAAIAVVLMMIAVIGSVYPVQEWPLFMLAPLFFLCVAAGVGYYAYLRKVRPESLSHYQNLLDKV